MTAARRPSPAATGRQTPTGRTPRLVALALAAVLTGGQAGWAIVVSDDPALHEVTPPSDFDRVGYTNAAGGATAVLIDPWFAVTAGHVVDFGGPGRTFDLHLPGGTQTWQWGDTVRHGGADLALIRLNRDTGLDGYDIYDGAGEEGQAAILTGYGASGTGSNPGDGGIGPRGTQRRGRNRIDLAGVGANGAWYMKFDLDHPGTSGTYGSLGADKEAITAAGDSGGPTFLDVGGELKLVGVHSFVVDADADGVWPEWNDPAYDVWLRPYAGWIDANIPDQPATVTGDFNMDGATDDLDIDALFDAIDDGGTDLWHDLTADGAVAPADVDAMVADILATAYGDTNLDGQVDTLDLAAVANHFALNAAGWRDGDFNGDDLVDVLDLARLANHFGGGSGSGPSAPSPGPVALLLAGGALLLRRRPDGSDRRR